VTKSYPAIVTLFVATSMAAASLHAQQKPDGAAAETSAREAEAAAKATMKGALEAAQEADKARMRQQLELEAQINALVPLDVQIVITRFQGEKKTSSVPYALTVNASMRQNPPVTQLRMGGRVPMPAMAPVVGPEGKPLAGIAGGGPVSYEEVGTSIDCQARPLGDGRFEMMISVSDSAVTTPQADRPGLPVIRTFRSSNNLVLRDGQTRQFTAAADRITGEVVRVDVTLKVAK
jgi:hypothetical protein